MKGALHNFTEAASEADFAVIFKSWQLQADLRAASGTIFISLFQPWIPCMIGSQVLT